MADYSYIANPTTTTPLAGVANYVNLAQGIQNYKLGNINLQKAQQLNTDRVALQNYMQSGKGMNPDGSINLSQMNQDIPKIAPLAGPDFLQHMTQLNTSQTQAQKAQLDFSNDERSVVSNLYGVLGRAGITDPQQVSQAMDNLKQMYPDNPNIKKYIDAVQYPLKSMPANPNLPKILITQSQSMLNAGQQQAALAPQATIQQIGGEAKPVVITPAIGGNAPEINMGKGVPITLTQGERQVVGTDVNGNPVVYHRDALGNFTGVSPMAGSQQPPMISYPSGESAATKTQFTNEYNTAAAGYNQSGYVHSINQGIYDALHNVTTTGTTGSLIAKAESVVGALPGASDAEKAASAYDLLGKFMERNALAATQAMGQQTNAALEAQQRANGTTGYNPTALKRITELNDAMQSGLDEYYPGLSKAIKTSPNQIFVKRQFDQQWAANFKPEVMELQNALDKGDQTTANRILDSVGGKGSPGAQDLTRRAFNLKKLSKDGTL